jgi:GH24 family phage-related lysozyme (muramidase)
MVNELSGKLTTLIQSQVITASATDQAAQIFTGKASDFTRVFSSSGGLNVTAYMALLNRRLRGAVGKDSLFRMVLGQVAENPIGAGIKMLAETLIPLRKQLTQFNDFVGRLGMVLAERAHTAAAYLRNRPGILNQAGSRALSFLGVVPESRQGPDLSRTVKGQTVNFDGLTRRAIIEVIPSYLADIHAELVAARVARKGVAPGDRKLYDYESGVFGSEKLARRSFEKNTDSASLSHFSEVGQRIGRTAGTSSRDMETLFRTLRNEQVHLHRGGTEGFDTQIDGLITQLRKRGDNKSAAAVQRGKASVLAAMKANPRDAARLLYDLQSATQSSISEQHDQWDKAGAPGVEGITRQMFNSNMIDPETRGSVGSDIGTAAKKAYYRRGKPTNVSSAGTKGEGYEKLSNGQKLYRDTLGGPTEKTKTSPSGGTKGEGYGRGSSGQKLFHDDSGKVTLGAILRSPAVVLSKAMDAFERGVSNVLFGSTKGKISGFLGAVRDGLMGPIDPNTGRHSGIVGSLIDTLKLDILGPLRTKLFGDSGNKASQESSLLGRARASFIGGIRRVEGALFGRLTTAEGGAITRQGGLLGGVVRYFAGQGAKLKEFLLGAGTEPGARKGLLLRAREGLERAVLRLQEGLFGRVGADGRRSGGLTGGVIQRGKDLLSDIRTGIQRRILGPLGKAFLGRTYSYKDAAGETQWGRRGGLLGTLRHTLQQSVVRPLVDSLFGTKTMVDDGKGGMKAVRAGGAVGQVRLALSTALAPLRNALVGPRGLGAQLRQGFADVWKQLKVSFFGEGAGKKPLSQVIGERFQAAMTSVGQWVQKRMEPLTRRLTQLGDWVRKQAIEPFAKWLNDPKTGAIARVTTRLSTFFDNISKRMFGPGGLMGRIEGGIQRFFYGDPKTNTPGFVQRVVEPAKKFVRLELWEPMKASVVGMWREAGKFFQREVVTPLRGIMSPFVAEAREQYRLLKDWVKGPLKVAFMGAVFELGSQIDGTFKVAFGQGLGDMLRNNVLNPIKDALSSVKKFLADALGGLLKIPVNLLRGAADQLLVSQLRRGLSGHISAATRERLATKYGIDLATLPHAGGSSVEAAAAAPKGAAAETATPAVKKTGFWSRVLPSRGGRGAMAGVAAGTPITPSSGTVVPAEAAPEGAAAAVVIPTTKKTGWWSRKPDGATAPAGAVKVAGAPVVPGAVIPAGSSPAAAATQEAIALSVSKAAPGAAAAQGTVKVDRSAPSASLSEMTSDILKAVRSTADNTQNIYQFVTKHLWGVGKNVERIVEHFRIADVETGKNTGDKKASLLGRLRRFMANPLRAASDLISSVFDGLRHGLDHVTKWVTNAITLPFRLLGKGIGALNDSVKWLRKNTGELFKGIKDTLLGAAELVVKGVSTVVREFGKGVRDFATEVIKGLPQVLEPLSKAGHILGRAATDLVKGLAGVALHLAEFGGKLLRIAGNLAKDAALAVSRITLDVVGSAVRAVHGAGAAKARLARLTPVYVVGGYLAGTTGGATTLTAAQLSIGAGGGVIRSAIHAAGAVVSAGLAVVGAAAGGVGAAAGGVHTGASALSGSFRAIRERLSKEGIAKAQADYQTRLLAAGEGTAGHLAAIRHSFSNFGSMLMLAVPLILTAITGVWEFFTKGKFISLLARMFLGRSIPGVGVPAAAEAEAETADVAATGAGAAKKGSWWRRMHGAPAAAEGVVPAAAPAAKKVGHWNPRELAASRAGTVGGNVAGAAAPRAGAAMARTGLRGGLARAGSAVAGAAGGLTRGVGGGMGLGLAGMGVNMAADALLEKGGTAHRLATTAGTMLEYAGMGAMVGGPWGAAIGAAVGAAVANWDVLSGAAAGAAGLVAAAGRGIGTAGAAVWHFFVGKDAKVDKDGNVVKRSEKSVLGRAWSRIFGQDEIKNEKGQTVQEGKLSIIGRLRHGTAQSIRFLTKAFLGEVDEKGNRIAGSSYVEKGIAKGASLIGAAAGWVQDTTKTFGKWLFGDAATGRKDLISRTWDSVKSGIGSFVALLAKVPTILANWAISAADKIINAGKNVKNAVVNTTNTMIGSMGAGEDTGPGSDLEKRRAEYMAQHPTDPTDKRSFWSQLIGGANAVADTIDTKPNIVGGPAGTPAGPVVPGALPAAPVSAPAIAGAPPSGAGFTAVTTAAVSATPGMPVTRDAWGVPSSLPWMKTGGGAQTAANGNVPGAALTAVSATPGMPVTRDAWGVPSSLPWMKTGGKTATSAVAANTNIPGVVPATFRPVAGHTLSTALAPPQVKPPVVISPTPALEGMTGTNLARRLTPVFVVGGYLADIQGGAKSLGDAQQAVVGGSLVTSPTAPGGMPAAPSAALNGTPASTPPPGVAMDGGLTLPPAAALQGPSSVPTTPNGSPSSGQPNAPSATAGTGTRSAAPGAAAPGATIPRVTAPGAAGRSPTATPNDIVARYRGSKLVGGGECVDLVKAAAGLGRTATWGCGGKVLGNTSLQPGTVIATMDSSGRYDPNNIGQSHAAIYLGPSASGRGIKVLDQWNAHGGNPAKPPSVRDIEPGPGKAAYNSPEAYSVVTKGKGGDPAMAQVGAGAGAASSSQAAKPDAAGPPSGPVASSAGASPGAPGGAPPGASADAKPVSFNPAGVPGGAASPVAANANIPGIGPVASVGTSTRGAASPVATNANIPGVGPIASAGTSTGVDSAPSAGRPAGAGGPPGISPNLLAFVKGKEGWEPKAKWDYKQNTNGYGTKALFPGEVISREVAQQRLETEMVHHAACVDAEAKRCGLSLNRDQREALISFDFNSGRAANGGTDSAGRKWPSIIAQAKGNPAAIPGLMSQFTHAGGEVKTALVERRAAEIARFNGKGAETTTAATAAGRPNSKSPTPANTNVASTAPPGAVSPAASPPSGTSLPPANTNIASAVPPGATSPSADAPGSLTPAPAANDAVGSAPSIPGTASSPTALPGGVTLASATGPAGAPSLSDGGGAAVPSAAAVNQAAAAAAPDNSSSSASSGAVSQAQPGSTGTMEGLLGQILQTLQEIAGNTGRAADAAGSGTAGGSAGKGDAAAPAPPANVFAMAGARPQTPNPAPSDIMRRYVTGDAA